MARLTDHWRHFEHVMLDAIDAGPLQREEMRKAYYAGASAMLAEVLALGDHCDEDLAETKLKALQGEAQRFAEGLPRNLPGVSIPWKPLRNVPL